MAGSVRGLDFDPVPYLIGVVNLHAVLNAAPGEVVAPVGLKGRLLGA